MREIKELRGERMKQWCIEKKRLHKFLKKLNKRKLVNQKPIAVSTDHRLFEKLVH